MGRCPTRNSHYSQMIIIHGYEKKSQLAIENRRYLKTRLYLGLEYLNKYSKYQGTLSIILLLYYFTSDSY
jgi:hypothetical protein